MTTETIAWVAWTHGGPPAPGDPQRHGSPPMVAAGPDRTGGHASGRPDFASPFLTAALPRCYRKLSTAWPSRLGIHREGLR